MHINSGVQYRKDYVMSKLAKEISMNKAAVTVAADKKDARKALAQSMLDSVSGGWVNAFARWSKSF
ncbi:hypothetical protein BHU62_06565 [Serratia marcescens]|uniref:RSAM-modified RiPP, XyeA family n=2 Tax=Serratia TaxID=613 RepID=A0A1Q4P361_SERMA|nr:hypothetical protein BHU62_06565 [Serratia marcescens]